MTSPSCSAARDTHRVPCGPAAYSWTCPNGNVVRLCVRCSATWWANAAKDPGLLPDRVDRLAKLEPEEPPDGAVLPGGTNRVWQRIDGIPDDGYHWWLTGYSEPLTWKAAQERGADPTRRLVELPDPATEAIEPLADALAAWNTPQGKHFVMHSAECDYAVLAAVVLRALAEGSSEPPKAAPALGDTCRNCGGRGAINLAMSWGNEPQPCGLCLGTGRPR